MTTNKRTRYESLASPFKSFTSNVVLQKVSKGTKGLTSSNSSAPRLIYPPESSSDDEIIDVIDFEPPRKKQRVGSSESRSEASYMLSERPNSSISQINSLASPFKSFTSNVVPQTVSKATKALTSSNGSTSRLIYPPESSSDDEIIDVIDFEPPRKRQRIDSSESRSEASYMHSERPNSSISQINSLASQFKSLISNIVPQTVWQWIKKWTTSNSKVSGICPSEWSSDEEGIIADLYSNLARKRQRFRISNTYEPRSERPNSSISQINFLATPLKSLISNIVPRTVWQWIKRRTTSNSKVSGICPSEWSSDEEGIIADLCSKLARKRQRFRIPNTYEPRSQVSYMHSERPNFSISQINFFASPFKSFTSNVVPQTVSKGTKRLISSNSSASRLIYPPDSSSDDEIIGIDLEPPRKIQRFGSLNTNESRSEVSCIVSECPHSANSQTDKNNLQEGLNIKRKEDQMQSEVSKGVQKDDLSEKEIDGNDREPLFFGNKESSDVNLASNMNCANIKRGGTLNSQKMKLAEARRLGRLERIRKYSVRITRLKKEINESSDLTASKKQQNVLVSVHDPVHLGKSSAALEIDESQDNDHTSPQASSSLNDI